MSGGLHYVPTRLDTRPLIRVVDTPWKGYRCDGCSRGENELFGRRYTCTECLSTHYCEECLERVRLCLEHPMIMYRSKEIEK